MKIKSERIYEIGPCGEHEKYAILFIFVMFSSPFIAIAIKVFQ